MRRRRFPGSPLAAGLLAGLGPLLLAAPVGLLWSAVSPRLGVSVDAAGDVTLLREKAPASADGHFLLITVLVGAGCGLVGYLSGRRRPAAVAVGLAVGGLLAGVLAALVGQQVNASSYHSALRSFGPVVAQLVQFRVRAVGVVTGWPVGALAVYALLTALFRPETTAVLAAAGPRPGGVR